MDYTRFERLILSATAVLILGTLAATVASGALGLAELVGQLAVLVVMSVAVHWGRRGGTISAIVASVMYLGLQLPLLSTAPSVKPAVLLVTRLAGYLLIGIVGGELFARMKYVMAASDESGMVDQWSGVYNQRYMGRALNQAISRHQRYAEPFSIVLLEFDAALTADLRSDKVRGMARTAASFMRDDVRLVDDVSRLDDGRYLILLPHTPTVAAPIVGERLSNGLCGALRAKPATIRTACLGAPEDLAALQELASELSPREADDQTASGA